MVARSSQSQLAWWAAVAVLLALHAALLLHKERSRPPADRVWVLLPLLPLSGMELEQELTAGGLLLAPSDEAVDPEHFGADLAQRLGQSAWLGPTMSVADFTVGLQHLGSQGSSPLSAGQRREQEPLLAQLRQTRMELERSEARMRELATELSCSREALLAALEPDTRAQLSRLAHRHPGDSP